MTRPKNLTGAFDRYPAFWANKVAFSSSDCATLKEICPEPEFIDALQKLAGRYQGQKSLQVPSPGAVNDRLAAIAKMAHQLERVLGSIDYSTRECLEEGRAFRLIDSQRGRGVSAISRELAFLKLAADEALEKRKAGHKPKDYAGSAEKSTVSSLRRLFESFGIKWSTYDYQQDSDYAGGSAAICLRIVLGKKANAHVGHLLKQSQY